MVHISTDSHNCYYNFAAKYIPRKNLGDYARCFDTSNGGSGDVFLQTAASTRQNTPALLRSLGGGSFGGSGTSRLGCYGLCLDHTLKSARTFGLDATGFHSNEPGGGTHQVFDEYDGDLQKTVLGGYRASDFGGNYGEFYVYYAMQNR